MSFEGNIESREREGTNEFITERDFSEIMLPNELPPYKGGGETSTLEKYDEEKRRYLEEELYIIIPEEWDRAMLITTFKVARMVLTLEEVRRADPEVFKTVLVGKNRQLREHSLDRYANRERLEDGRTVESITKDLKFSANPEKRVSKEELKEIVRFVFESIQ